MSDKFLSVTINPKQSNKHHFMSYFFQSEFNKDIGRSICMTKIIFFYKIDSIEWHVRSRLFQLPGIGKIRNP